MKNGKTALTNGYEKTRIDLEEKLAYDVSDTLEAFQDKFPGIKLKFNEWQTLSLSLKYLNYRFVYKVLGILEDEFPNKEGTPIERQGIFELRMLIDDQVLKTMDKISKKEY